MFKLLKKIKQSAEESDQESPDKFNYIPQAARKVLTSITQEDLPIAIPSLISINVKLQSQVKVTACIRHVAASSNHVLVCTDEGKCFGWGSNQFGKLGLNTLQEKVATPKLNEEIIDHHAIMCAVGANHSLFLTKTGLVFSAGLNEFGQLGITQPPLN